MEPEDENIWIGERHEWGGSAPFGLNSAGRRQHLYVLGQTGTGKSTLLRNLVRQDLEAGRGLALIDPHGDLAEEILEDVPTWRADDLVYFHPLASHPVAMNLFRSCGDNWHLVASGIVSAFRKVWADSWGPRLEYILFATLSALIQCENTSLLGVSRMLYDARYRAWVVRQVKDPMVRSFWINEFETYETRFLQEVISPVQNKVGQLLFAPAVRNILCQVVSKINFRFMMDRQRIFIANLCKGELGETHTSLLGSLLVTAFEVAALSRADSMKDERTDFYLYVDEFQNCATSSFASMLSEARKFGLSLTIANQHLGQLEEEMTKAIFGNVGTLVSFRVGEADASTLERQFGSGYSRDQFTGLENFELCARVLNREPFRGRSLFPRAAEGGHRERLVQRSSEKYGTKRELVEERIERWLRQRH